MNFGMAGNDIINSDDYPTYVNSVNTTNFSTDTNMSMKYDMNYILPPQPTVTLGEIFEYYAIPVLVILGTTGNIMILVTIRQRNLSNWSICFYLGAYAIGNILILVPILGLEWVCKMAKIHYIDNLSDWTCKLWQFLMNVIIFSGVWFIVAMLIDQFIAIWLPLKAMSMCTVFMAKFATIMIIVGLIVISIHAVWTYELFPNGCYIHHEPNDLLTTMWPWVSLGFYCILPLILILLLVIILVIGVFHKNEWKKSSSNYQVPTDVTFMTIGLAIFYVLFATPATVIHVIHMNLPNAWLHDVQFMNRFVIAQEVCQVIVHLNPALALLFCILFSSTVRNELRDTLKNTLCKHVIRVYEMQMNSNGAQSEYEQCSETTPLWFSHGFEIAADKKRVLFLIPLSCLGMWARAHCRSGRQHVTGVWPDIYRCTVNFQNIRTPKTFVVITLKVAQDDFSLE